MAVHHSTIIKNVTPMQDEYSEDVTTKYSILAIDPSINSLGWAALAIDKGEVADVHYGTIKADDLLKAFEPWIRVITMTTSCFALLDELVQRVLHEYPVYMTAIEEPQQWGALKSTASRAAGHLLTLCELCGALLWAFQDYNSVAIPVWKHKGQLPKRITTARMEKLYGITFVTDDEADAVWIANWAFKQTAGKA